MLTCQLFLILVQVLYILLPTWLLIFVPQQRFFMQGLMRREPQMVCHNVLLAPATVVWRHAVQHFGMAYALLDGMGGMILVDLALMFSLRLNWRIDNLLVYLEYVDDVFIVAPSGNGSDGSKGEIERVD